MLVLLLFSAVENYIETKGKAYKTTSKSSTIKGDNDIVDENQLLQPLRHTTRESNQTIVNGLPGTKGPTEADISDETLIATGTDEFPWRLPRSATILGVEEQSLGTFIHQRRQSSHNEVKHSDMSQDDESLANDTLEPPSLPAYERNYYVDRWYISLAIFNFVQALYLSGAFLTSASTVHTSSTTS
ncbi:hypothetical protein V500_02066 [Pseudogymnoascus sp. VKM F-4518 (FW-2643)]|nr:hypothetical protein V500_02066 [Pseudogymnoascus sp. VKM F-4518 (FW-2643)]